MLRTALRLISALIVILAVVAVEMRGTGGESAPLRGGGVGESEVMTVDEALSIIGKLIGRKVGASPDIRKRQVVFDRKQANPWEAICAVARAAGVGLSLSKENLALSEYEYPPMAWASNESALLYVKGRMLEGVDRKYGLEVWIYQHDGSLYDVDLPKLSFKWGDGKEADASLAGKITEELSRGRYFEIPDAGAGELTVRGTAVIMSGTKAKTVKVDLQEGASSDLDDIHVECTRVSLDAEQGEIRCRLTWPSGLSEEEREELKKLYARSSAGGALAPAEALRIKDLLNPDRIRVMEVDNVRLLNREREIGTSWHCVSGKAWLPLECVASFKRKDGEVPESAAIRVSRRTRREFNFVLKWVPAQSIEPGSEPKADPKTGDDETEKTAAPPPEPPERVGTVLFANDMQGQFKLYKGGYISYNTYVRWQRTQGYRNGEYDSPDPRAKSPSPYWRPYQSGNEYGVIRIPGPGSGDIRSQPVPRLE